MNKFIMPVLFLAIVAVGVGQIGKEKVYACSLDNLSDCISGTTDAYAAGQQDATYDHQQGLQYNPVAACCHSDDWDNQFRQGYDTQWNSYQSSSQTVSINVENSPGATVNVGQTSNQNQGPSETPVGCDNSCGGPGCDSSCGNPCNYGCSDGPYHHFWFHHFGCGFSCGYGYRHIGFENP